MGIRDSNPSEVAVFDDYHGEYTVLGNPHIGDEYAQAVYKRQV